MSIAGLAAYSPVDARAQNKWQHHFFVTSDDVRLHYIEAGQKTGNNARNSTIVFVPGWTMPAWIWQSQIEHFAASHRVVALDPRGQGESEKATQGYTADRSSRDICELLDHLDDESVILVGWSIAGQHVLLCTDEVGPDVVHAVVVVDWDIILEADRDFAANRIASVQGDRKPSLAPLSRRSM